MAQLFPFFEFKKESIYQTAQAGDNHNVSGYAWSEHIGWIKFDPQGSYPASPNNHAKFNSNNREVFGWARACAGAAQSDCTGGSTNPASGGWDGWIKLGEDDSNSNTGVYIEENPNTDGEYEFKGWAWGGDVIGWISFNCKDRNICDKSNYKVVYNGPTNTNRKPEVENLNINSNYCKGGNINFSWRFNDPDGDIQSYYEIQIATDNAFNNTFITATSSGNNSVHLLPIERFSYNTTYYARVKVKDSDNLESDWAGRSFTTPQYPYPDPEFTFNPERPITGETVNFTDESKCYISGSEYDCKNYPEKFTYNWNFGNNSNSSNIGNASTTYNRRGTYSVTLEITDTGRNVKCARSKSINIRFLPQWKEIP